MSTLLRLAVFGGLALWPALGLAAGAETSQATIQAPPPAAAAPVQPVTTGSAESKATAKLATPQTETQQYCSNIAAAAADARFAWQRKQLTDLQAELKQRVTDLDAKEAEFKAVMAKRDDMMKKAADTVVGIYSHMKPDAAATQLAALDDDMAAAILAQLTQQKASVILNEIPAEKAAKLVTAIATLTGEKKS